MADHYTKQSDIGLVPDGPNAVEEARKLHHLATADPEPERGDGTLTGPAHEEKYGLERAEGSAAHWRSRGVHPTENRALVPGDEGYDAAAEAGEVPLETADAPKTENTAAPRVKK
jgi:hypothetical protein